MTENRTVEDILISNEVNSYVVSCYANWQDLYKRMRQDIRILCAKIKSIEKLEQSTVAKHSDFNVYPHSIFASVFLYDGKIINWKTGNKNWTVDNVWMSKQPYRSSRDWEKYSVYSTEFIVDNEKEHNEAFEEWSTNWYKQWELVDGFNLMKPY